MGTNEENFWKPSFRSVLWEMMQLAFGFILFVYFLDITITTDMYFFSLFIFFYGRYGLARITEFYDNFRNWRRQRKEKKE